MGLDGGMLAELLRLANEAAHHAGEWFTERKERKDEAALDEIAQKNWQASQDALMAQYHHWKNSLPGMDPALSRDAALSFAAQAEQSPRIRALLPQVKDIPAPASNEFLIVSIYKSLGGFESLVDNKLASLWEWHKLSELSPLALLANLMNYRDALVRGGRDADLIQTFNVEIGRFAHAFQKDWLEG